MLKTFSIFSIAVISAFTIQAQTVTQNIRLNKGQKLESVLTTTVNMSQEMMGQQVEFNSNSTATTLTEVKDITSQSFIFANTVKRIVSNTSVMGQEIKFDSDKKEDMDGQVGAQLKGKIGVEQSISTDKQGKIIDVQDTSSVEGGDMISAVMGSGIFKGATFPLLVPFPAKGVKTGDTWTDSSGTPETMKMVNTYTLKQVAGNEATIAISGQMAKTGVVEAQGMQMTMNLNGIVTGESVVDLTLGTLKKNSTIVKMNGTMEVMGQSIPLKMTSTTQTVINKL